MKGRLAEIWVPLMKVAHVAGGPWPRRIREAANELSGKRRPGDESLNVVLLRAARDVFGTRDEIWTADLISGLNAIEDAPWRTWNPGKDGEPQGLRPIDFRRRVVDQFKLPHSKDIRVGDKVRKGYARDGFEAAWRRYLHPEDDGSEGKSRVADRETRSEGCLPATPATPATPQGNQPISNPLQPTFPGTLEPLRDKGCSGVAGMGAVEGATRSDSPSGPSNPPSDPELAQLTIDGTAEPVTADGAPAIPKHPARYSTELMPVLAAQVPPDQHPKVLDPFAGVGGVHDLPNETTGVELEPEWAGARTGTIVADALALPFPDGIFDAIVTSPTYGNRFADHHNAKDGSPRRSYTHDIGRDLHRNNSGAMHWGSEYRTFHLKAWAQALQVLRPGGRFVLNISDHIRDHERQPVTDWHVETLTELGLHEIDRVDVPTKRMRHGENADARVDAEHVITFEKSRPDNADRVPTIEEPTRDPRRFTR
jgi:SAM-dependent methyltransferase